MASWHLGPGAPLRGERECGTLVGKGAARAMSVLTSTDRRAVLEILDSIGVPATLNDVSADHRFPAFAMNRLAEAFLGQRDADVVGKTVEELAVYPSAQLQRVQARFEACVRRGEQVRFEDPAPIDLENERRWIQATMTPILDTAGTVVRILVTFVDVSEWRRAQEALSDALTKVLSGFVTICSACKKVRHDRKARPDWLPVEEYVTTRSDIQFSHAMCPECFAAWYGEEPTEG